jgi:dTDP-4-amino-4,6-dideoxygalactose transaminase
MWSRIRLDIGLGDIAHGLFACLVPPRRERVERELERLWSADGDAIASYSVRSAFDLLFQALALSPGSEVLFSALNVKGMIKIAERHGLVPVPVDLDLAHMGPDLAALERAASPRARVLVVAHLFGARLDLDPIAEFAERHRLLLVEDCAQAFMGLDFTGHPKAAISMFSFGPLKTATAIGGALSRVRDSGLLGRMRAIQSSYPVQGGGDFAVRLLKFAGLKLILTRPVFAVLTRALRSVVNDYEDTVGDAVRGVAKLGQPSTLRKRPAAAMLAVLLRRLRHWSKGDLRGRIGAAEALDRHLRQGVLRPATANPVHTYWVYPILAEEPKAAIAELRRAGFDGAQQTRSQAVAPPADRPELDPRVAREALARLIILPCYPAIPEAEIAREAEIVNRVTDKPRAAA